MPPEPATLQPLSLISVTRAMCLCLLPFTVTFSTPPPLPPSACAHVSIIPWGVCLSQVPPSPLCPWISLPEFYSGSYHFPVLVFLSGGFLRKEERPGKLHSLSVACTSPFSSRYLDIPEPFRLPGSSLHPLHPHLAVLIPSPWVESVGHSSRSRLYARI